MGGSQSHTFNEKTFNAEWERREGNFDGRTVWRNKLDPTREIEEYPIFANNENDIKKQTDLFRLRQNSNDLVAATHLKQTKKGGLCSSASQGRLYLEKIPLRLSDVQHIPFPDVLHLHSNLLSGYRKLANEVGFFRPQQEQVGFNLQGQAKVWLNNDFSASRPSVLQNNEGAMVGNIIRMVQENTDLQTMPRENPSILNFIYQNRNEVSFNDAQNLIRQYAQRYFNGNIPNFLECIQRAGGIDNISRSLHGNMGVQTNISNQTQPTQYQNYPNQYEQTNQINGYNQVNQVNQQIQSNQPNQVVNYGNVANGSVVKTSTVQPAVIRTSNVQQTTTVRPINVQPTTVRTSNVIFGSQVRPLQSGQNQIRFNNIGPVQQQPIAQQQQPTKGGYTVYSKPIVQQQEKQVGQQSQWQVTSMRNQDSRVQQGQIQSQTQQYQQGSQAPQNLPPRPPQQIQYQPPQQPQQSLQQPLTIVGQGFTQQQQQQQIQQSNINGQSRNALQSNTTNVGIIGNNFNEQKSYTNSAQKSSNQPFNFTSSTNNNYQSTSNAYQTANTANYESSSSNTYQQQQQKQQQDNNYGFEATSSRYKDVSLQDGKSSEALLAELRNLSSKNYTTSSSSYNYESYTTSGQDYSSKDYTSTQSYTNKDYGNYGNYGGNYGNEGNTEAQNYSSSYNNNYEGKTNNNYENNDQAGIFKKYAQGGNLQDNLEMKYSMTQELYDNQNSQRQEGEYQVDYDPEILADIQKMRN